MATPIPVEGTSRDGCEQSVESILEGVRGVANAEADRQREQSTVTGGGAAEDLVAAVEDAGCSATA